MTTCCCPNSGGRLTYLPRLADERVPGVAGWRAAYSCDAMILSLFAHCPGCRRPPPCPPPSERRENADCRWGRVTQAPQPLTAPARSAGESAAPCAPPHKPELAAMKNAAPSLAAKAKHAAPATMCDLWWSDVLIAIDGCARSVQAAMLARTELLFRLLIDRQCWLLERDGEGRIVGARRLTTSRGFRWRGSYGPRCRGWCAGRLVTSHILRPARPAGSRTATARHTPAASTRLLNFCST